MHLAKKELSQFSTSFQNSFYPLRNNKNRFIFFVFNFVSSPLVRDGSLPSTSHHLLFLSPWQHHLLRQHMTIAPCMASSTKNPNHQALLQQTREYKQEEKSYDWQFPIQIPQVIRFSSHLLLNQCMTVSDKKNSFYPFLICNRFLKITLELKAEN